MPDELTQRQLEFRSRIYSAITWISLAAILAWYVLKSVGVIQTPLWIELLPVGFAVFGAGAFIQEMRSDIARLKGDVGALKGDVGVLKHDVGSLKGDLSLMVRRADHLEADMHYVKARV